MSKQRGVPTCCANGKSESKAIIFSFRPRRPKKSLTSQIQKIHRNSGFFDWAKREDAVQSRQKNKGGCLQRSATAGYSPFQAYAMEGRIKTPSLRILTRLYYVASPLRPKHSLLFSKYLVKKNESPWAHAHDILKSKGRSFRGKARSSIFERSCHPCKFGLPVSCGTGPARRGEAH